MDNSQNSKGEYSYYTGGKLLGYSPITLIQGKKVLNKYVGPLTTLIGIAKKENISLVIDSAFRTWDEQYAIRKGNVIDKSKIDDFTYITTADNGLFNPRTAKPGYSNHQDGSAVDFNVNLPNVYKWMVHNAAQYGWVRSVESETWHWQYLPGVSKFQFVPQNHTSWDGLT